MKIGFYGDFRPCLLKENGVVDITRAVASLRSGSPQLWMEGIIRNFGLLRPKLKRLEQRGPVIPLAEVRLRPPVPRPGKIICGRANYKEGIATTSKRPMALFFKSPDAVSGPGDTILLPPFQARIFHHEAELCVVIGKEARNVPAARALEYIFGYLAGIDVSARAPAAGESLPSAVHGTGPSLPGNFGKSFDGFNPIGPAIATADAIRDPHRLQVRYRVNGELRQDYNTSDMEHQIPDMMEALSAIMTLKPGDLIMCGTNHQGLGPLQDGDVGEIEVEGIGRFSNPVVDPLKRTWPHGVDRDTARYVREMRTAAAR